MKLLLDTHALLWWFTDDPRLSLSARRVIGDGSNEVLVSAACAWELAIKHRLGKLGEARAVITRYDELCAADSFTHLPITRAHALLAGNLNAMHRDPFDRMLAAQSHIEDARLVSADAAIATMGVDPLW